MDLKDISKDWEMARSLSEELKLHYDYYEPYVGTDKSLSLNITLWSFTSWYIFLNNYE